MEELERDVRAFLRSAWEAQLEHKRHLERAELLKSKAEQATAVWSGPASGHRAKRPEDAWIALADERERVQAAAKKALQRYQEVEELINALDKPEHRAILRLRYLQRLPWHKVQKRLETAGIHYTERQIYRLHAQALKEAQKTLERGTLKPVPW